MLLAATCVKKEAQPEEALRQVLLFSPKATTWIVTPLILAIRRNLSTSIVFGPEIVFHYGPHDFTCQQVRESQEAFLDLLSKGLDAGQLSREITKKFRVYRGPGVGLETGRCSSQGIMNPLYEGSLTPDETFRFPL